MPESVKILGIPEMAAKMNVAARKIHSEAMEAIREETEAVKADAQSEAPVDTGALRDGIRSAWFGLTGEVRSTARHSTFVEHGTYSHHAHPFMEPAASRSRGRFKGRVGARIRAALEGLGR